MNRIVIAAFLTGCVSLNALAADLATVNGKPVKQSLMDFIIKDVTAQGKKVDEKSRANIIEKLITTEVIDQEAVKSGITSDPDYLVKEELTLHELRVNAYIEDYLKKNPIDDKTLRAEYDKLSAQSSGKEYNASHILVKTENEAKAIISQLSKGADFAQLAKENSLDSSKDNGGDLGWFQPEGMVQPFSDAVAKLQKGRYSTTPVQTQFGWHIIHLNDVRDTNPPSFEAVKAGLANELQKQQLDKLVNTLKANARIVINTETNPAK